MNVGSIKCLTLSLLLLAVAASAAGCGPKDVEIDIASGEPIELGFYVHGLALTTQQFEDYFTKPTKERYPHVTLQPVWAGAGMNPNDLVSTNNLPDIVFTSNRQLVLFNLRLKALANLDPLIEANRVNLDKFEPVAVEVTRMYGMEGEMTAIPYAINQSALFYSKDLFDHFGVDYPIDGMTWDQAMDIHRRITRVEEGKKYRGLEPTIPDRLGSQLQLPLIDQETLTAAVNTPEWRKIFQFFSDIYKVPGAEVEQASEFDKSREHFLQHRTTAMMADWLNGASGLLEETYQETGWSNWDMVQLPYFSEAPGVKWRVDIQMLGISVNSPHKDAAFAVINHATSVDVQKEVSKYGRPSAVKHEAVQAAYAANLESFQGKNIAAVFKGTPAKLDPPTDYDNLVVNLLTTANRRIILNKEDIDVVLRETHEEADLRIIAEKAK